MDVRKAIGNTSLAEIRDGTITGAILVIQSHIGMIVHSSTLDTEAKVKAIYGGVRWTKIEGKMLLGASATYPVNSTGGEATHTLTTNELPTHTHSVNIAAHGYDGWPVTKTSTYSVAIRYD